MPGRFRRILRSYDFGIAAALAAMLAALLACKGSAHQCDGAIDVAGKRYSSLGDGSSKEQARDNALMGSCMFYCQWGDPGVERAYSAWKETPEGRKSKAGRGFEVGTRLKRDYELCTSTCVGAVKRGSTPARTECT
jgi:hypothetical protein